MCIEACTHMCTEVCTDKCIDMHRLCSACLHASLNVNVCTWVCKHARGHDKCVHACGCAYICA